MSTQKKANIPTVQAITSGVNCFGRCHAAKAKTIGQPTAEMAKYVQNILRIWSVLSLACSSTLTGSSSMISA